MLELLIVIARALALAFRGHREFDNTPHDSVRPSAEFGQTPLR
jgi:hypothetical protein